MGFWHQTQVRCKERNEQIEDHSKEWKDQQPAPIDHDSVRERYADQQSPCCQLNRNYNVTHDL